MSYYKRLGKPQNEAIILEDLADTDDDFIEENPSCTTSDLDSSLKDPLLSVFLPKPAVTKTDVILPEVITTSESESAGVSLEQSQSKQKFFQIVAFFVFFHFQSELRPDEEIKKKVPIQKIQTEKANQLHKKEDCSTPKEVDLSLVNENNLISFIHPGLGTRFSFFFWV